MASSNVQVWFVILVGTLVGMLLYLQGSREVRGEMFVSPEMKIPVEEFQKRNEAIQETIKSLEAWVVTCKTLREWSCAYKSTFHNSVGARIRALASGELELSADRLQAYMDLLQTRVVLPGQSIECFSSSVPEAQTWVTEELQRQVGVLEAYLASEDVQEAKVTVANTSAMLDQADKLFRDGIRVPPKTDLWVQGSCPREMWAFSEKRCCPENPTTYDAVAKQWTACPVQKKGSIYQCGLTKDAADKQGLPVCRPDVSQGPCKESMYFYGPSKGGFCCPLIPAGFDEQTGEYTTCRRGGCGLDQGIAEYAGLPACSDIEGFSNPPSLKGQDLLDRADALIKEVREIVATLQPVADRAKDRQAKMLNSLDELVIKTS